MKKRVLAVAAAEIAVFFYLLFRIVFFQPAEVPLDLAGFTCAGGTYGEASGWTAEKASEENGAFLVSPPLDLARGSYVLRIAYTAARDQSARLTDTEHPGTVQPEAGMTLSRHRQEITERCDVSAREQGVRIEIGYGGSGAFTVSSVRLTTGSAMLRRELCLFLLFAALLDVWLFSRRFREDPFPLGVILSVTLLCSLPLFMGPVVSGHDFNFHIFRIESIADGLRRGVFPLRLSTVDLYGWGYMTSVYYGEFLLYPAALLRIIGFSVTDAYKGYILLINLLTAASAYFCFTRMFRNRKCGALLALIYCTSVYRLMDIYLRAAVGEYSAMLFLPLIAAGFYDLVQKEVPDRDARTADALLMAAGFAGLACTHLLSTEIALAAVFIAALFCLPRLLRPPVLLTVAGGAALALLLAACFEVPFLDCVLHDSVRVLRGLMDQASIQKKGAIPAKFFSFFYDFRTNSVPLTTGIPTTAALLYAVWLLITRKGNRRILALALLSALFFWFSTNVFPWQAVENSPFSFMHFIQFPWRWLTAALLPLTILCGELLLRFRLPKWAAPAAVAACVLSVCVCTGQYAGKNPFVSPHDFPEIENWYQIGGSEYLRCSPTGSEEISVKSPSLADTVSGENLLNFSLVSRTKGNRFEVKAAAGDTEGALCFPLQNYRGYAAHDGNGNALPVDDGPNFCVRVTVPAGFDGTVILAYEDPLSWRLSEAVSFLAALACLFPALRLRGKRARTPRKMTLPETDRSV